MSSYIDSSSTIDTNDSMKTPTPLGVRGARYCAAFFIVLLPVLLLSILFVVTHSRFVNPVIISCVFICLGLAPDLVLYFRTRPSTPADYYPSGTSTNLVVPQEELNEVTKTSIVHTSIGQFALIYVPVVIALAITSIVSLHHYSIWSYDNATIAMLYLPESSLDGTSMGIHVRIPLPETAANESQFRVAYWPTDSQNVTTTDSIALNITNGGTGDVLLTNLDPDVEYSYAVAVEDVAVGGLFQNHDELSGTFRSLPNTDSTTLTFLSTSCTMVGMSIGRDANIFNELLGKGAQLGLFLGDFVYMDVPNDRASGPGEEWKFENRYRHMFSEDGVRNALGAMPWSFAFDDHEIKDDYESSELTDVYVTSISQWRNFLGGRNPHNKVTDVEACVQERSWGITNTTIVQEIKRSCSDDFDKHIDRQTFQRADHFQFNVGPARFFLVDGRRFRDDDIMLGAAQTTEVVKWIEDSHVDTVTFVVSPVPWTLNYYGGWKYALKERDLILDAAMVAKARGVTVMFISGDQHRPGIYELRDGLFEVSASPLDSTTTAFEFLDFQNEEVDKTIYEEAGFNNVFALWNINTTHVSVDIYAGGRDLFVIQFMCLLGGSFGVGVLAWVFLGRNKYVMGICFVLIITLVVTLLTSSSGVETPRFKFDVTR